MALNYRNINIAGGWAVFVIATAVYFMTLEPTASWWDASERITAAYKLEVPHPPGAPFFILMGRFFTMLAPNPSLAAVFMNAMSALAAAFTVMLLFWIITHLARKFVTPGGQEPTAAQTYALIGSAFVGAMAFCFSDTQWFIAVEAEAYATSGLFTALVFWAILKWENVADHKYSASWLILITYLMGLSIGVHLLNLLAIPAIVFVYYFRKFEVTPRGIFWAAMVSVLLLGSFVYVIIPGVVRVASWFELLFVNSLGLPFHSGLLFFIVLTGALLGYGLWWTQKNRRPVLNTIILGMTMVLIGYSSYAVVVIRASANPPMNQNAPDNVFRLISYLAREQYGDNPLFFGQYYSAPQLDIKEGRMQYIMQDGRYVETTPRLEAEFHPDLTGFFPRMWSNNPSHVREYRRWGVVEGRQVRVTVNGEPRTVVRPTFTENIRFFLRYQVWHMYGRYFMWNFVGRQNDHQGHGELLNGNWLSGIGFIDSWRLGPQNDLPDHIASHPARNTYFFLPLLLGLLGMFHHYKKQKNDFAIVLMLFFFTGLAIIIYLNQTPLQPRERDYTYAGSFMAFSIWIGIGVLAIIDRLQKKFPLKLSSIIATAGTFLLVPALMAQQNWDDHDRSGRFTARDFAFNYLNTTAPDAILFTHGDNDTFPLWYAQEVEGVRTDVRVVNLMLLNAEWYIEQQKQRQNDSPPVPLSLPRHKYLDGTNNLIYMIDRFEDYIDARQIVDFIADDSPGSQIRVADRRQIDYIPTTRFRLRVDADRVIENNTVAPELRDQIVDSVEWEIDTDEEYLLKNQMMVLDLLATNNWERPVYYISPGTEDAIGLQDFFQLEGFAYRLVPIRTESEGFEFGRVNTEAMYENFMHKFDWGRMEQPDVYLDHYNIRTLSILRLRNKFARLANALTEEGDTVRAVRVLDRCMELMPVDRVPPEFTLLTVAEAYFNAGEAEKANAVLEDYFEFEAANMEYFLSFPRRLIVHLDLDMRHSLQLIHEILRMAEANDQLHLSTPMRERFNLFMDRMIESV